MRKFFSFVLASLLLGACAGNTDNPTDQGSFDPVGKVSQASHSWNGYRWRPQNFSEIQIPLDRNLSSAWVPYLEVAASQWNTSSVIETSISQGSVNPKTCRPVAGRVQVCNSKYGRNGWLGLAQVWLDSDGYITQATVKLNDTYFAMPQYSAPVWRSSVMCQEVGHVFGLDHQDENFDNPNLGTCMDYSRDPAAEPANDAPNAHDYEELENIYSEVYVADASVPTPTGARVVTHILPVPSE